MKTFQEYTESQDNIEKLLIEVFNLAWNRYTAETSDFLFKISSKDPEIKEKLNRIEFLKEREVEEEKDVISKNAADSNFGDSVDF